MTWGIFDSLRDALCETGDVHTIDEEGWLHGPKVVTMPSPRTSLLTTSHFEPLAIVWHYTATKPGTMKSMHKRLMRMPVKRKPPKKSDRDVSWHFGLSQDGTIYQAISCMRGGWHCKNGYIEGHRTNRCTVGVELEGDGGTAPAAQIDAARVIMNLVSREYRIAGERRTLGHRDLDPHRKSDPGPLWGDIILPQIATELDSGLRP